MAELVGLEFKALQVKLGFLYGTLRYRYETLLDISLLQNLGLHITVKY